MSFSPRRNDFSSDSDDDDGGSLFGSPPPSPGRSPSNGLALPGRFAAYHADGASDASTVTQNVGTIALPGSLPSSELFVNPLAPALVLPEAAPSLSHVSKSLPARVSGAHDGVGHHGRSTSNTAGAVPQPPKRAPVETATAGQSRPGKRKSRTQSGESTPRATVAIPLPDPSAPPPPNWLRSQSALLGVAGLVGGVRPSNLTVRGATPSNPIIIEEDDPPIPSKSVPPTNLQSTFKAKRKGPPRVTIDIESVDLSKLPTPSREEILDVLIKEKDIVTIIDSLRKLGRSAADSRTSATPKAGSGGANRPGTGSRDVSEARRGSEEPGTPVPEGHPTKKRKLSEVPAGAADWDIPYPFPEGEGPESYQQTWKSKRGRQLITQLVNLGRIATRKAAIRKYFKSLPASALATAELPLIESDKKAPAPAMDNTPKVGHYKNHDSLRNGEKEMDEPRINKYYKPITATYGLNIQRARGPLSTSPTPAPDAPSVPTPAVPSPKNPSSLPSGHLASSQGSGYLDEFLFSLLALAKDPAPAANKPPADLTINPSVPRSSAVAVRLGETDTVAVGNASLNVNDNNDFNSWMAMLHQQQPVADPLAPISPIDIDLPASQRMGSHMESTFAASTAPPHGYTEAGGDWAAGLDMLFPPYPTPSNNPVAATGGSLAVTSDPPIQQGATMMGFPDELIDPQLLALGPDSIKAPIGGAQVPNAEAVGTTYECLSGTASPQHSASAASNGSFTGGPSTPASANWDMGSPDVFDGISDSELQNIAGIGDASPHGLGPVDVEWEDILGTVGGGVLGNKGKERERVQIVEAQAAGLRPSQGSDLKTATLVPSAPAGSMSNPPNNLAAAPTPMLATSTNSSSDCLDGVNNCPSTPITASAHALPPAQLTSMIKATSIPKQTPATTAKVLTTLQKEKEEVIRKVKARKAELEAELEKVKLQLWETTVEQGGLSLVLQRFQEQERVQQKEKEKQPLQVLAAIDNTQTA